MNNKVSYYFYLYKHDHKGYTVDVWKVISITLGLSFSLGWHAVTLICTNWLAPNITNLLGNIMKQCTRKAHTYCFVPRCINTLSTFCPSFLVHIFLTSVSLLNIPHASWAFEFWVFLKSALLGIIAQVPWRNFIFAQARILLNVLNVSHVRCKCINLRG